MEYIKVTKHQLNLIKNFVVQDEIPLYSMVHGAPSQRDKAIELVFSLNDKDDPLIMRFIGGDPNVTLEVDSPTEYTYNDLID